MKATKEEIDRILYNIEIDDVQPRVYKELVQAVLHAPEDSRLKEIVCDFFFTYPQMVIEKGKK